MFNYIGLKWNSHYVVELLLLVKDLPPPYLASLYCSVVLSWLFAWLVYLISSDGWSSAFPNSGLGSIYHDTWTFCTYSIGILLVSSTSVFHLPTTVGWVKLEGSSLTQSLISEDGQGQMMEEGCGKEADVVRLPQNTLQAPGICGLGNSWARDGAFVYNSYDGFFFCEFVHEFLNAS